MKEIILTCPFTGVEFKATIDVDRNLYVKHPITGDVHKINYNRSIKRYNVPEQLFKHVETVTFSEAAQMLEVTRQRISAIASTGVIETFTVNGQSVFKREDVVKYKETRSPGAPKRSEK